jgi:hypothetical protein
MTACALVAEALNRKSGGIQMEQVFTARTGQRMAVTSLEAYRSLPVKAYLQAREQEIVDLLADMELNTGAHFRVTREKLAACLGRKEGATCGRVDSLLTKGALVEDGEAKTTSGRSAKLLRLADEWSSL